MSYIQEKMYIYLIYFPIVSFVRWSNFVFFFDEMCSSMPKYTEMNCKSLPFCLIGSEMPTLSKSKVGKNLDGFFFFFDCRLDQIFNGEHSQQFASLDQRQVTNIGGKHLCHTDLNGFLGLFDFLLKVGWR